MMQSEIISPISDHKSHLGEGPIWDWSREVLWWVDSFGPLLYQFNFHTRQVKSWKLPGQTIGSLAVRECGDLILAMDKGFYHFSSDTGKVALITEPLANQAAVRFNDGKVDSAGNFIAGAMNLDHSGTENCSMLRLSSDFKVAKLLEGFTCFNGPCFNPTGDLIYLTGRTDGEIEVFDYDTKHTPRNGKTLIKNCNPDGATVDDQGFIWSAQWDDGCIIRISPDGQIDYEISIPGQIVASVMFGGPDFDLIYVTTVGGIVNATHPKGSEAGLTLEIKGSGFKGRPENMFKG